MKKIKPLFRWLGGKTNMVKDYKPYFPESFDTYVEPFFGGGSMMLEAVKINPNAKLVIGDINSSITNIYKSIQSHPEEFLEKLDELCQRYIVLSREDRRKLYYEIRHQHAFDYENYSSKVEEAAVLYFLLCTCFNGIYESKQKCNNRFSSTPGFLSHIKINPDSLQVSHNVKYPGRAGDRTYVYDKQNVMEWHRLLKNAVIVDGDYRKTIQHTTENAWVFMDPPYRASSIKYGCDFDDSQQKLVVEAGLMLRKTYNAKVWISNRDINDGFFDEYINDYNLQKLPVPVKHQHFKDQKFADVMHELLLISKDC